MKRGSAEAGVAHGRAGHFNFVKIEVSRPSVPLLKAELHRNKGKMTANTPVSAENRSRTSRIHKAGHFVFPIHSKCPAEVSRCYPATVEAGARAADDHA